MSENIKHIYISNNQKQKQISFSRFENKAVSDGDSDEKKADGDSEGDSDKEAAAPPPTTLSPEQQNALNKFIKGENLFISGPAGTGKSFLIKSMLKTPHGINGTQVCATTGIAAVLLDIQGCCTIHSWSGIGIPTNNFEKHLQRIKRNKNIIQNWRNTKILIIDEISMMSKQLFELLDYLAKKIRRNNNPFGGLQIVLIGDLFQLPPVGTNIGDGFDDEEEAAAAASSSAFCFESSLWFQIFKKENHIELTKNYRQNDLEYLSILNEIRIGKVSRRAMDMLSSRIGLEPTKPITKLFSTRMNVERINSYYFNQLEGEIFDYNYNIKTNASCWKNGTPFDEDTDIICEKATTEQINNEIEFLMKNNRIMTTIQLKVGAYVMCTANLDLEQGICNGSQGIITEFSQTGNTYYPTIQFNNGVKYKMNEKFQIQSNNFPNIIISQLPLAYCWALTIHKSQGCTLTEASIDCSKIFEFGQCYVALSRVKSLDGLYLLNFNPRQIKANPLVVEFYKNVFVADDDNKK